MEILSETFLPPGSFPDMGISQSLLESSNNVTFIRLMDILFDHKRNHNMDPTIEEDIPNSTNPLLFNSPSDLPTAFESIKIQNSIHSKKLRLSRLS